jgi:hypothetical protein
VEGAGAAYAAGIEKSMAVRTINEIKILNFIEHLPFHIYCMLSKHKKITGILLVMTPQIYYEAPALNQH